MKILVAASEVAPFAKTGGLADVAGSLPKALKKLGHDVRIIMPYYKDVDRGNFAVRKGRKSISVRVDSEEKKGLLRWTELHDIPVYLLENNEFFFRDGIYGTSQGDYEDSPQRFSFFCRGVLELLKKLDFRPDIIHCNDWQTALIPVLLRHEMQEDLFFSRTSTLYTIHNLAYQGVFERQSIEKMALSWDLFTMDLMEYYGKVNLMKGGILSADIITTVSPTYATEILTPEYGCGLEGVLQTRKKDLYGILNGIDDLEWNPETDQRIHKTYTSSAVAAKSSNKKGLQKLAGLPVADVPVVGMVTRLTEQKGIDLVLEQFDRFEGADCQLVILGDGEERYLRMLEEKKGTAPNISITFGFDDVLARMIYAGSDIFLMPSRFEPCGIGQLLALRYGTVPVVRKTGGLADTVSEGPNGNGFIFTEFSGDAMWEALERGLTLYRENRTEWRRVVRRGMTQDHSWTRSARQYDELYRKALAAK